MKNKYIAGILGILFGWCGAHKFYLGKTFQGILHFVFPPFGYVVGIIEGARYLSMSDEEFDVNFNMGYHERVLLMRQRKLMGEKMLQEELAKQKKLTEEMKKAQKAKKPKMLPEGVADELAAWYDLKQKGIIEEWEYDIKKKELLGD